MIAFKADHSRGYFEAAKIDICFIHTKPIQEDILKLQRLIVISSIQNLSFKRISKAAMIDIHFISTSFSLQFKRRGQPTKVINIELLTNT